MTLELCRDHVLQDAGLKLSVREEQRDGLRLLNWTVRNEGARPFRGVVRLRLALPEGFSAPWLMVPGFVYGENRRVAQWSPKLYPRFDPHLDAPSDMASSWWDFPADRTAAPLVFWHQDGRCFAAAAEPHYAAEGEVISDDPEPQLGVGFGHNGRSGYVRFSLPACEEPFTYSNAGCAPTVRRMVLEPGVAVGGRVLVFDFRGERHGYQRVMELYHAVVGARHEPAPLPDVPALVSDAVHGIVAGHYDRDRNYFVYSRPYDPVIEQIANARGITSEWHQMMTGFVNGFPVCLGLLLADALVPSRDARETAVRVADRICREGVSPSGLFWADFMPETVETRNGSFPNPLFRDRAEWGSGWLRQKEWVHSRTIADACNSLAGMIALEQSRRPDLPSLPLWREALEGNLRVALDLQQEDGTYGQYYHALERRVTKTEGCGGLLWIPALVKAARMALGGAELAPRLRESLERAGAGYAPYVEAENIWGAPEDNDSPTSEDGMNAVMAYADLYELTREPRWLALARTAADWMLTFRKAYNQKMPPDSLMGRYGMRSKGGDFASASNNHLHVFEVLVTRRLCRLSDWTGNPYYRDRARDHWAFVCQCLSRCDGMYNGFRGAAAEQFYWCNYGSWGSWLPPAHHVQKGNMAPFTAIWCIAVMLLAAPDALELFS